MVSILSSIPNNVAGFRVTGTVTRNDYDTVIVPVTETKLKETGEINFLLLVDTEIGNFTLGAWARDFLLGLKHITKWNRAAIVTDDKAAIKFTDGFSYFVPGEFRGFPKDDFDKAVGWVSGNTDQ